VKKIVLESCTAEKATSYMVDTGAPLPLEGKEVPDDLLRAKDRPAVMDPDEQAAAVYVPGSENKHVEKVQKNKLVGPKAQSSSAKPTGSVGEGLVLSDRPGLQVEMIEEFGTTLKHAANLAVIVSAMANTVGGTIYIGVIGNGLVRGVKLSRREKDDFSQMLDLLCNQLLKPRFHHDHLKLIYAPVCNLSGDTGKFIIRIQVKAAQGKVFTVQNVPNMNPAIYKRKRKGPRHTFQVTDEEALRLLNVDRCNLEVD